jgi:integrase/recombinase XerD
MSNELSVIPLDSPSARSRILAAALNGLSDNSRRAYTRHLGAFINWLSDRQSQFHRESVIGYLEQHHRTDTATYNQALSAIKRLADQAAENQWISWPLARSIDGIPCKKLRGTHAGNWLTIDQARALIDTPDRHTLPGKRDRCVIALLLGCGLRRDELSRLEIDQIQSRDNRTMLVDIVGKGNRVRSIGVPKWADAIMRDWWIESGLESGPLVRSFKSDGRLNGSLSVSAIWDIVQRYSDEIGVVCTPHDLRRTYAKLARTNGAPLETIQHSLGHASISTTQRYMRTGEEANAGDWIDL